MTTGHWLNLTDRKLLSPTAYVATICVVTVTVAPLMMLLMLCGLAIKSVEVLSK